MIPPGELAQLARLYDRFANHLDPLAQIGNTENRNIWIVCTTSISAMEQVSHTKTFVGKRNAHVSSGFVRTIGQALPRLRREALFPSFAR